MRTGGERDLGAGKGQREARRYKELKKKNLQVSRSD